MASATAKIHKLVASADGFDVHIGSTIARVVLHDGDSAAEIAGKRSQCTILVRAYYASHPVTIVYDDGTAEIILVQLVPHCEIAVVPENPIGYHGALFSVTGIGIPADDPPLEPLIADWRPRNGDICALKFEIGGATKTVAVDFSRPTLAIIAALPSDVPIGVGTVKLVSHTAISEPVPVEVRGGAIPPIQIVQPGAAKARPFTVVFIGNRRCDLAGGNISDPILDDRARYGRTVAMTLWGLWSCRSDLFSCGGRDAEWRIVSIYDPSLGGGQANTLVYQNGGYFPYAERAHEFASSRGVLPDITVVVQGFSSSDGAVATVDDAALASTPFTYDGVVRQHAHFATTAGSLQCYAPTDASDDNISRQAQTAIALHEFLHAFSSRTDGHIDDLYDDDLPAWSFTINKRFRCTANGPIPELFATYNNRQYRSHPVRGVDLPYPPQWRSYHCERARASKLDIMDGANAVGGYPDRVTDAFVRDRLDAKLGRS
jgi:hypothetical protein